MPMVSNLFESSGVNTQPNRPLALNPKAKLLPKAYNHLNPVLALPHPLLSQQKLLKTSEAGADPEISNWGDRIYSGGPNNKTIIFFMELT